MIDVLIRLAKDLDSLGLHKEADLVDAKIQKLAAGWHHPGEEAEEGFYSTESEPELEYLSRHTTKELPSEVTPSVATSEGPTPTEKELPEGKGLRDLLKGNYGKFFLLKEIPESDQNFKESWVLVSVHETKERANDLARNLFQMSGGLEGDDNYTVVGVEKFYDGWTTGNILIK